MPDRRQRRPPHHASRLAWPLAPLLLALGCGGAPTPTATAPSAVQQSPPLPAEPLAPAGYVAVGFPPADREWTAADYEAAADRLNELAARSPAALPRVEDERSAPYFARMIDRGPIRRLETGQGPIDARIQESGRVLHALQAWLSAYLSAGSLAQPPDVEFVELTALALEAARAVMGLARELLDSLPPEQAADPERQAGTLRMQGGLEQMVSGSASLFLPPDRDGFRPAARARLARHLVTILPPILATLSPAFQAEVRDALVTALASETDDGVREALEALVAALARPIPPSEGA